MSPKGLLGSVVPHARRKPGRAQYAVLIGFLVVFAAVCLGLELTDTVTFTLPWWFLLSALLPWFWWMHVAGHSGLAGVRSAVAVVVRLALAGIFIMLIAGPRAVRKSDELAVIFAVDVSDSIGQEALDNSLTYVVHAVAKKTRHRDEAGMVVFGRNAAVELPPSMDFRFEGAINSQVTRGGTDLARALSLSGAMLSEGRPGRIVLISDGTATEGITTGILEELKARDIPVDVLPISYETPAEVWLEKLDLPVQVKVGETYEASVVLSSHKAGKGTLRLFENGERIFEGPVEFTEGKNRFTMPLYLREAGYYQYRATIETAPGQDGWKENNQALGHVYLRGKGMTLLVTDPNGDAEDYGKLVQAMQQGKFLVSVCDAYDFPDTSLALMQYDCIVFVNVPADAFHVAQMQAVHDAVFDQGVGFIMVGGKNSFGPGGYHRTAVERALPVTMDIARRHIMPKGALAIILHTCEFAQGNTWGRRIAKEAMRVLGAEDEVGVLAYDNNREGWVFPMTPAREYNRLVTLINQAVLGDMPSFQSTMRMGLTGLMKTNASSRHMIIISDGDPAPPTPQLLKQFVTDGVSVSTVGINPHGPQDINILRHIAGATGGRFYYPQDPNTLPSIFVKEAKTLKRSLIQNREFAPEFEFASTITKGIDAFPDLFGYVLTTPKEGLTQTVLKVPSDADLDPLLTVWTYGVGRTAAWTSDLGTNWAKNWIPWDKYQPFVRQLLTYISRTETKTDLLVTSYASGGRGVISVRDTHEGASLLDMTASVRTPEGTVVQVPLTQEGPDRYEGEFDLSGKGDYVVTIVGGGGGRKERATGGFAVPYSAEYLRFKANPRALYQIADATGGRVLEGKPESDEVFVEQRPTRSSGEPVHDWFLILLACLVPLDVAVRRIQLDAAVIAGWLGLRRRKAKSTETLGALLRAKKSVTFVRPEEQEDIVPSRRERIRPARPHGPPKPPAEAGPAAETPRPSGAPMSTTERLLAMRRRLKDQGKDTNEDKDKENENQ